MTCMISFIYILAVARRFALGITVYHPRSIHPSSSKHSPYLTHPGLTPVKLHGLWGLHARTSIDFTSEITKLIIRTRNTTLIDKSDVKAKSYDGNDSINQFNSDKLPSVHLEGFYARSILVHIVKICQVY